LSLQIKPLHAVLSSWEGCSTVYPKLKDTKGKEQIRMESSLWGKRNEPLLLFSLYSLLPREAASSQ
jgi:hypothetical protein